MIDYHIHTNHSIDAEGNLNEYCEKAIKLGLKEICITNHCELDLQRDDNLIRFDNKIECLTKETIARLQDEVDKARQYYKKSGLIVRFGIEVGYFEGVEERLDKILNNAELDYLLAGIHCLDHICIDSSKECEKYFSKKNVEQLLVSYYEVIKKLIKSGLFDTIAHIDVYKKYGIKFYGDKIKNIPKELLVESFKAMAKSHIVLEINTAGLRRVNEFYPSPAIMKLAKEQGIRQITMGSDCHKLDDLAKGIKEAIEYARSFGFDAIMGFNKREPNKIKI